MINLLRVKVLEGVITMTNNEQEAINKIAEAAELLGWQLAFPSTDEDISYVIIARSDVIEKVVSRLED